MSYSVKEIFKTLQGEGFHSGRAAVFCRFSGCNLWNGLEKDRLTSDCKFCDTDFIGTNGVNGGKFKNVDLLVHSISKEWGCENYEDRYVVLTGGEPLLQVDVELIDALHNAGFFIAIETNGTIIPPDGIDWICVSPKVSRDIILKYGNELKVVYPQSNMNIDSLLSMNFEHFFLQPLDDANIKENTRLSVEYCITHPKWHLSLQTHKYIGIP
ncbi:7-carboxy-7-deazaguanine synthase [Candidatus Kinetoplastidibacterium crithidiae]|uniref:7-carboxy-7-deazaguanine synthase n=1 Tax=Candidatus Kinetoplastidibacterium crithidiae TCC036E TaxID=1208918 RepID=M1L491_9PROT|nr:7-carboxy-7-deazaguanine synthase [Candidatus Kinetoplastibacterium crithidii]AFZ82799.1 radical SAM superfamily protein 3 [Candidatus Kinetoplastibacterium crithidii (ex Angomonas deanei ATCC 30255)]AGF47548.1 organic radical activating enzyme [Candidatus Kinetoplastibacterium crithidii TCC036E]